MRRTGSRCQPGTSLHGSGSAGLASVRFVDYKDRVSAFLGGPGDDEEPADDVSPSWVSEGESAGSASGLFDGADASAGTSWMEEAEATEAPAAPEAPKPAPVRAVERGKMKASALDDLFSRAKDLKKKS